MVLLCYDHTVKEKLLYVTIMRSRLVPLKRKSPRIRRRSPDLACLPPGVTVIACVFWGWARDCSSAGVWADFPRPAKKGPGASCLTEM